MATKKASTSTAKKKAPAKKKPTTTAAKTATVKPATRARSTVSAAEITQAAAIAQPDEMSGTISDKFARLRPGALIGEFVGTFVLAAAMSQLLGQNIIGNIAVGLVVIALTVALAAISGAHLNPAITITSWIHRKTNGVRAIFYIVAQILGGLLALLVMSSLVKAELKPMVIQKLNDQGLTASVVKQQYGADSLDAFVTQEGGYASVGKQLGLTTEMPNKTVASGSEWTTAVAELLGSVIFGLGVGYAAFACRKKKLVRAVAVGSAFFVGLTIAGTTAILNPAAAIAQGAFSHWNSVAAWGWPLIVWALAAVVGTLIGYSIYRLLAKDTGADKCCACPVK
ncbi:MAG: aquaporin [Candidatus Nomurabacteria bacterium]|jgi:glycerol uptake facilitator-like aquaporin|nr:aquaporin [Candidatus Nomurabacteria bacterium]